MTVLDTMKETIPVKTNHILQQEIINPLIKQIT